MKIQFYILFFLLLAGSSLSGDERKNFTISTDFPGGNLVMDSVQENVIHVKPDVRDSSGECAPRHWAFRVRNAEGQTLRFQFPKKDNFGFLSTRGPAVSKDNGKTWIWQYKEGEKINSEDSFEYQFGPKENSILFSWMPLYTGDEVKNLVDTLTAQGKPIRLDTLCHSDKGRKVDLIRFGNETNPDGFGIMILARNHANEIWASFVVQGLIKEVFSGSSEGNDLLKNASFFVVPFVDKDGFEDGDPGKARRPHDHNRDYDKGKYASVRAIKEKGSEWAKDKKILGFDIHSCSLEIRGLRLDHPEKWAHNHLFLIQSPKNLKNEKRFAQILENEHVQKDHGFILYDPSRDGLGDGNPGKASSWMGSLPNAFLAVTMEVPFARPDGRPVTSDTADQLGRNIAKALAVFIKESQLP